MPAVEVSAGYTFMTDLSDGPEDLNFPAGWSALRGRSFWAEQLANHAVDRVDY
jgi:hypothetical protein